MNKIINIKNAAVVAMISGFAVNAFAQGAVAPTTAPTEVPGSAAPVEPAMPSVGMPAEMGMPADQGAAPQAMPGMAAQPAHEQVAPVPTPPVAEVPKADPDMVQKIAGMVNNKDIDGLMVIFPKHDFNYITAMGANFSNADALRKHFVDLFAGPKYSVELKKADMKELAPGVAYYSGNYAETQNDKTEEFMFTIVAKYDEGAWKVASLHMSPVMDAHKVAAAEGKSGGGSMALIAGLLGVLVGYFANRFASKKPQETA